MITIGILAISAMRNRRDRDAERAHQARALQPQQPPVVVVGPAGAMPQYQPYPPALPRDDGYYPSNRQRSFEMYEVIGEE